MFNRASGAPCEPRNSRGSDAGNLDASPCRVSPDSASGVFVSGTFDDRRLSCFIYNT